MKKLLFAGSFAIVAINSHVTDNVVRAGPELPLPLSK
jgi:hypothetical protein